MPAIAVCQATYLLLIHRYRGQARSHILIFASRTKFVMRKGHNSVGIKADCSHGLTLQHKPGNAFGDRDFL